MKTIGILTKPKHPRIQPVLKELVPWLRGHGKDVILDSQTAVLIDETSPHPKTHLAALSDMVLVLGGDGTMLNAARLVVERSIPILGVNMGGLGFLTEISLDQMYQTLETVFANQFHIEERLMLDARIHRHGEPVAQATVLNDVVVSKGHLARMIQLHVSIDGQFVTNLRGDGLIIGSSTGSTAYSLSAGGPILQPSVEALLVTPICPHTLTHRPLIVPGSVLLEVILTSESDEAMTTFDGQIGVAIRPGDTVVIGASPHRTHLIRMPEHPFYEVLRKKLKWGDG